MRIYKGLLLLILLLVLAACGEASQEKVLKKLDKAWSGADGYEIEATMELNTGTEPKTYKIEVWHTEPEFYKVEVNDENDVAQLILRNEEGVFVVTPSTNKSYKFQSEWPHKNSQAYMLEGLLQQIKSDSKAEMKEEEKTYVFTVGLQDDKSGLPSARIVIDKKSLKPKQVVLLDESEKEQVSISFKKTEYESKHSKEDYALEKYAENKEKEASPDIKDSTTTYYPQISLQSELVEEETIQENGITRTVMSFNGDKSFTLVQQPIEASSELLPVFAAGDPAHVGPIIGAVTDTSVSWQQYGKEFFIASNELTMEELLQVAGSLVEGSLK